MAIWRRVACRVSKATRTYKHARARAATHTHTRTHAQALIRARTHTHTQMFNTYYFSTETIVSLTRLNVTFSVHCLSCYSVRTV
jgi:hypothetical protein